MGYFSPNIGLNFVSGKREKEVGKTFFSKVQAFRGRRAKRKDNPGKLAENDLISAYLRRFLRKT
jgi:hypothetical protein